MHNAENPTLPVSSSPREDHTLRTQRGTDGSRSEKGTPAGAPFPLIAGYDLEKELGRGGMGVVYQARQTALGRPVALKMILHAEYASADERQRFSREAEALARLRHENIVQVYELGEHDGRAFISLEFVEGGSLAQRLRDGPLPAQEAARLVEQLARAMEIAHAAGILHRDLKPANILLAACGLAPLHPKITDFGLARRLDEAGQTHSGAVLGTPSYMAPEQAAGNVRALDARTDIYALGAILYECLTGRPPFRAATVMETLQQVLHAEPVSVRSLQPATPADLETICLKCLQKEPARRYPSAQALAEDLARFQRREPVQARPVGRLARGWRWCRRNPLTAGLTAAVALALLAGAIVSAILAGIAADEAEYAREKAADEAAQRRRAERSEGDAVLARNKATDEEQAAKRQLYVNRLRLVQSLWQEGNVGAAQAVLDELHEYRDTWECRYLFTLLHRRGQHTLRGHGGKVTCVAVHSQHLLIAAGDEDHKIILWEPAFDTQPHFLEGHTGSITGVAFLPDGWRLASTSADGTIRLWDLQTLKELRSIDAKGKAALIASSPDGRHLATGSGFDDLVRVWDIGTGKEIASLQGCKGQIQCVAYSPDGKRIAAGTSFSQASVWDAASGEHLYSLKGITHYVNSVAFSPDGSRLLTACEDGTVRIWDVTTGKGLHTLQGNGGRIFSAAWSPDGKRIAASDVWAVKVWNLRDLPSAGDGQPMLALKGHFGMARSVAFSADGRWVVSGGADGAVKLWDLLEQDAGDATRTVSTPFGYGVIDCIAFHPSGRTVLTASEGGTVHLWNARTGRLELTFPASEEKVSSAAYSHDGKCFATTDGKLVRVWDSRSAQPLQVLRGHEQDVLEIVFSPDNRWLVSSSHDKTLIIWDVEKGTRLRTLQGHEDAVASVSISSDGKICASASYDRSVKLWETQTGRLLRSISAPEEVICCALSPDGRHVAAGTLSEVIGVWDVDTGRQLFKVRSQGGAKRMTFLPQGGRLATCSIEGTVRIWDAFHGLELLTLRGHEGVTGGLAFSADGSRLVSASGILQRQGQWKLWDASFRHDIVLLSGEGDLLLEAGISPDGTRIVAVALGNTLRAWDNSTRECLWTRKFEPNEYGTICFTEDGNQVTLWNRDLKKNVFFDLTTGEKTGQQNGKVFRTSPLSRDGRWFVSALGQNVRLYPIPKRLAIGKDAQAHEEENFLWHAQERSTSRRAGDSFAALFHIEHLVRLRPWDPELHVRKAHQLVGLGRMPEAATHFLQAVTADAQVPFWLLDHDAFASGSGAALAENWPLARNEFESAVRQPQASVNAWYGLVLALAKEGGADPLSPCREMLDLYEKNPASHVVLLYACQLGPTEEADARRLVALAQKLVMQRKDDQTLALLGAALLQADRPREAIEALDESIRLHAKGGRLESLLTLALAKHRIGQFATAREILVDVDRRLPKEEFDGWQMKAHVQLRYQEARRRIPAMPPAEEGGRNRG